MRISDGSDFRIEINVKTLSPVREGSNNEGGKLVVLLFSRDKLRSKAVAMFGEVLQLILD